jgi:hypothetical protein
VVVLVATVVPSAGQAQDDDRYPQWFIQPPTSNRTLWAVGYAQTYLNWTESVREAKADAYDRMLRTRGVRIAGERLFEAVPGRAQAYRGESFSETVIPDTLRRVAFVDSARVGDLTLVLAGWRPDGAAPTLPSAAQTRMSFAEAAPSWTHRTPASSDRLVTVAVAPRYYYATSSWALAERRGRQRLALRASAALRELRKTSEQSQHAVTSLRTDVRLRNVQVRRRWMGDSGCYVLVEGLVEETFTE